MTRGSACRGQVRALSVMPASLGHSSCELTSPDVAARGRMSAKARLMARAGRAPASPAARLTQEAVLPLGAEALSTSVAARLLSVLGGELLMQGTELPPAAGGSQSGGAGGPSGTAGGLPGRSSASRLAMRLTKSVKLVRRMPGSTDSTSRSSTAIGGSDVGGPLTTTGHGLSCARWLRTSLQAATSSSISGPNKGRLDPPALSEHEPRRVP